MDRMVAHENKNKSDDRDERWQAYQDGYHYFEDNSKVPMEELDYSHWPEDIDNMTDSVLSEWIRGWKTACTDFFNFMDD